MFIDLDAGKGEWFTFRMSHLDENTGEIVWGEPIEGTRVKIRSWKKFFEDYYANREMITEWKINPKTRQNEKHTNPKPLTPQEIKEQREAAIDFAILELEGWKDKKTRKVIECVKENKIALMALDFFDRFFADCQRLIDSQGVEEEREEQKN